MADGPGRHRGPRPPGGARRRHRPLPAGRRRRPRRSRAASRRCGPSSTPSPTPRRCTAGWPSSIRSPPARMEPSNRRRVVRALEVTLGSGRPFSSFGPGLETYPPLDFPIVGLELDRDRARRRASSSGSPASSRPASSTRCAACRPARRPVPDGRPGPRLPGAARPPRRRARPSTRPSTWRSPAPGASPAARSGGSAATRALVAVAGRAQCLGRHRRAAGRLIRCSSPNTTAWPTTSSSCSTRSTAPACTIDGDLAVAPVRPPHRGRRRRADPRGAPADDGRPDRPTASTW